MSDKWIRLSKTVAVNNSLNVQKRGTNIKVVEGKPQGPLEITPEDAKAFVSQGYAVEGTGPFPETKEEKAKRKAEKSQGDAPANANKGDATANKAKT